MKKIPAKLGKKGCNATGATIEQEQFFVHSS